MITEKGILPIGLQKNGIWHRDFELRPGLIKDSIEVGEEHEPSKLQNQWYAGLALTAKQIVRIGDISPVPFKDFAGMLDKDMQTIRAAQARLDIRLDRFHDAGADEQVEASNDIPGSWRIT